jgi:uncharacterized surface protein with fasciclin (FAS1) repeats
LEFIMTIRSAVPALMARSNTIPAKADIVDAVIAAGSFKTLVAALKAAGLTETLKGSGPFTVFAPMDEAFAKLPAGTVDSLLKDIPKLQAILICHVVPGQVLAKEVVGLTSAKTVQGQSLTIDSVALLKRFSVRSDSASQSSPIAGIPCS